MSLWELTGDNPKILLGLIQLTRNPNVPKVHRVNISRKDSVRWDIWRLKVPPKLCHFVWKGCWNFLPVRTNLQRRGICLETSCPLCEGEVETQVHIFFRCPFARVFWFGSPLQLDVAMVVGEDFLECWNWLCAKYGKDGEPSDLMRWVVCGLWRIWKCRNS